METAKVVETVPLRMKCSECKRFYNAISKPNGEIDGKCPYCHAKYHEHSNDTTRLIKIIRKRKVANNT